MREVDGEKEEVVWEVEGEMEAEVWEVEGEMEEVVREVEGGREEGVWEVVGKGVPEDALKTFPVVPAYIFIVFIPRMLANW